MKTMPRIALIVSVLGMGMYQGAAAGTGPRAFAIAATSGPAVDEWDLRLGALAAGGDLRIHSTREDTMLPGRAHTRFDQFHRDVPVWGAQLVRQDDAAGTLSVFGVLHEGLDVDTRPSLGEMAARSVLLRRAPPESVLFPDEATLTLLPTDDGHYRLTWRARVVTDSDILMTFVDAHSGEIVLEYSDLKSQSAVGTATGVLGDAKKMSALAAGSTFQAQDALRPPVIQTIDLKGNLSRLMAIFARFPGALTPSDYASDADNDWTDGAAVDAHVYAGYTYDYFFKRFGRRGLDNANIPIRSFVHPVRREDAASQPANIRNTYYVNAFYAGVGVMVYGEGLPSTMFSGGQRFNYFSGALDVVGHELTHGVTDFSSDLIYRNESGALNEAFSDIMGTAIEFYYQTAGSGSLRADYLVGEDIATPGTIPVSGFRSLQNPRAYGDPDHYSDRYLGPLDNGGVHSNSGIVNHAFYLAIEGGTHRLGGRVTGVGSANREQIERVFYRAFTSLLVPSSGFSAARAATVQAARELYPANGAVEAAMTQAWNAVGVN